MAIDTRKILHTAFDKHTENVDNYNHNGSTWLIFTDEKKWVIELTKEGTLWYNYYFFQNIMKLLSLEVVENQHYITEWVEDNIISKVKKTRRNGDSMNTEAEDAIEDGVKQTKRSYEGSRKQRTKDTIQNGVKYTGDRQGNYNLVVEDTIQNGLIHTRVSKKVRHFSVEDTIQNGVKHTEKSLQIDGSCVIEDVIKEGVKHTEYGDWLDGDERLDDIIENGIKETTPGGYLGSVEMKGKTVHQFEHAKQDNDVEDVIKSGVKECIPARHPLYNPMDFSVQYRENHRLDDVASVLEKGIKEVQPLPSQEGNKDWGDYYHRQEDRTKPHTQYVNDVITNGIKETWGYEKQPQKRIDEVIMNGQKD